MICDEVREDLEFYALGLLEENEQARIARHLRAGCPVCEPRLQRALALNAAVLASAPAEEPGLRLRAQTIKVLAGQQSSVIRWPYVWAAAAASVAGIAVWTGLELKQTASQFAAVRSELAQRKQGDARIQQALAVLSDPRTRLAVATTGTRASYYLNPTRGVVLIATSLPAAEPGRAYQMWIIPKGQSPRPAGLFQPDEGGTVVHVFEAELPPGSTAALAVSVEPETGSAAPTTTPMLVAPVAD
jgi:anti-sigma-K factor RskA